MRWFLFLGLIRDRSRSLFPLIVTTMGVFITVFLYSFMKGEMTDIINTNAHFYTGHVKIVTRAYYQQMDQAPNDLALLGVTELQEKLYKQFPGIQWTPRIMFGGLLDIPDEQGETRSQGPATGMAVDLLNPSSGEVERLDIEDALVQGRLPAEPFEILVSENFAKKLDIQAGNQATLISSGMYGSMAMHNFEVVGTVHFGVQAMDRGGVIADISGIRTTLNMENGAGELLGFFKDRYEEKRASAAKKEFQKRFTANDDEFAPTMIKLSEQNDLGTILQMVDYISGVIVGVFVFVMSIVLWNTGLMGTLRRYGEYGVRLAIGEDKGHIYRSMIAESLMIGLLGSVFGTALGLAASYYMQAHGINISEMMTSSTMLMPDIIRARVTITSYYIGFFPGFMATTLGSMIAGLGIYKRETAQLFKELEVQ